MTRLERPIQVTGNGHEKVSGLSPRDKRLFVNNVTHSPVPDIDSAQAILPRVGEFYKELGVPPSDRKRIAQGLETKLYGGTAQEQVKASETLQSIEQTYRALREAFPGRERAR